MVCDKWNLRTDTGCPRRLSGFQAGIDRELATLPEDQQNLYALARKFFQTPVYLMMLRRKSVRGGILS